jgi:hypothetical protein
MSPFSSLDTANGGSVAGESPTNDFTRMCRYSPRRLSMMLSTTERTFACVAAPEILTSRFRVPEDESALSEIIEYGCWFERVGGGAVPQPASITKVIKMVVTLNITPPADPSSIYSASLVRSTVHQALK